MATIEGPKDGEYVYQKLHFWKFLLTVCCGINDDTDDEHSFYV